MASGIRAGEAGIVSAGNWPRGVIAAAGGYALLGGLVSFLGWVLTIPRLTDWNNEGIAMMPNAAIGAMSAGAALILLAFGRSTAAAALGLFVGLLGSATLFQHITGIALGIDTLLFGGDWGQRATVATGRMGPTASASFTILGMAIFLSTCSLRFRRAAVVGGMLVSSIAMLSVIGYLLGADPLFIVPRLTAIALQTASILLALGLGLIASADDLEPIRTLREDSAASTLVRRGLPFVIVVPIVLGWLHLHSHDEGWFDAAFGSALLVCVLLAVLAIGLWWAAGAVRAHEQPLRRERERLTLALTAGRMGVYDWKLVDGSLWWSPEVYHVFGVQPGQFVPSRDSFTSLVHPEDREALWRALENAIQCGELFVHEFRIIRPDGQVRWINNLAQTECDGQGRPVRNFGTVADITERKHAEQALHRSEMRFRASQDASLFGFTILKTIRDQCGAIMDFEWEYVNPAAANLLQRPAGELVGRRLLQVLPSNHENSDLFARYVRVVETGQPHDYELRYRGEGIEGWFRNMTVKLHDGVAVSFADITEQKRAEAARRESEERFRIMADSAPIIIWVTDQHGNVQFINRAYQEFFGATIAQIENQNWQAIVHPDDAARYTETFLASLRTRQPWTCQARVRRADGKWRWIESQSLPRFSPSGEFLGAVGCGPDITEQKEAVQALKEADRRKDEFLAMLAHELRGPLAPLSSALDVVKRAGDADDVNLVRHASLTMRRQVTQLVRLVDDLLDVSRITRGKIELRKQHVELGAILRAATESCGPLVEQFKHELSVSAPPEPIWLDADPARLTQVFHNLFNNACKYTPPRGHVWVTVQRQHRHAVVRVRDDGVGIPTEQLASVFEPFTQLQMTLDRAQGGLGLGLALVKRLVEKHGGSVDAHSEGPGRGSEFVVRLPTLVESPARDEPPVPLGTAAAAGSNGRRVLVVDDNKDAAHGLALLLKLDGHRTQTAHDGEAAVRYAETFAPEVVFLDIGLPKLDGYAACRAICEKPQARKPVMVALTGWGQEEDRRKSKDAGFDHHLVKPVNYDTVAKLLASLPPQQEVQPAAHSGTRG